MEVRVEWVALFVSACLAGIAAVTYWRSGAWRQQDSIEVRATASARLDRDFEGLRQQVSKLPTAETIATHDQRLRAVEDRVKGLPTSEQFAKLAGSLDVITEKLVGMKDTLTARLDARDEAYKGVVATVNRIDDFLRDSTKA